MAAFLFFKSVFGNEYSCVVVVAGLGLVPAGSSVGAACLSLIYACCGSFFGIFLIFLAYVGIRQLYLPSFVFFAA